MMLRLLTLILILPPLALAALRSEGNHHFQDRQLRQLVRQNSTASDAAAVIESAHLAAGYLTARCDIKLIGADTVLTVVEGRRFRMTDLVLSGIDTEMVSRIVETEKRSAPATREKLENLTQELLRQYANNGYPFAQVEVAGLTVAGAKVALTYRVVTGPRVAVGRIEFPGIKTTRPELLRRRISLQTGAQYREDDLTSSQRVLARQRHCRPEGRPVLMFESRDNTVDVQLPMRDERSLTFEGFAYLQPDNSVAGQMNASLMNSLGRGEEAAVFWSRAGKSSSRLSLRLMFPYVADLPFDIEGRLVQEDRDSTFVGISAQIDGSYHLSSEWNVGAGFNWEKITPEEGRSGDAARLMAIDLKTLFDQRDNIRQTRGGVLFEQHLVSAFRKSFPVGGGIVSGYSTHVDGDVHWWRSLSGRLGLYQRAHYFQTISDFDPIPPDQLTTIGGARSLRGFRENAFLADRGVIGSSEVRWYAADNFVLHLFSDNGYIRAFGDDRRLSGFGAGMTVMTTAGEFRLELSLGEEKRINQMLVHLGLEAKL